MNKEKRAVLASDHPRITRLYQELSHMEPGDYVPVGTVEFTRTYCGWNRIGLPTNISYPTELVEFLGRSIWQGAYYRAQEEQFVKPLITKLFTGALKKDITESVDDYEPVWISDPVVFTHEFRFYIIDKQIAGYSRYDDGEDDDVMPDFDLVNEMVKTYKSQPVGYSIDVGITDGKTLLVEVNDGWALGLYPWGNMTNQAYVELIAKRWKQILETQ